MTSYDPAHRVWSGPKVAPLFDPSRSVGEVLLGLLERNPDKTIQINADSDTTISRGELKLRAIRIAQHLRTYYRCDVVDDSVTIVSACNEQLLALTVALQFLGVPCCALYPNYTQQELVRMMVLMQSSVVFCDAWNYKMVREATDKAILGIVKFFIMDGEAMGARSFSELLEVTGSEERFRPYRVTDSRKAICSVFASSGSTGPPKAVCLSHANKLSLLLPRPHKDLTFLTPGSLHWFSSAFVYDMAIFYEGKVVVTSKPFSEDLYFDLLEKYSVNHVHGTPFIAYALAHHPRAKQADLSSIKWWSIGGYYVSDAVRDAVDAILPNGKSYTVYGSTETGAVTSDSKGRMRGAVGILQPNIRVRVVDDEGNSLGIGDRGELLIKRNIGIPGYICNEEQKAEDSEGWFHSGDIGYFDEDGYLYLVDRKSDIFKYISKISPTELEDIIIQVDGVAEVCVVGIPTTADQSVEVPTAVIVRQADSTVSEEYVVKAVEGRVMDHKRIRGGVYFVDALPKTSKGNVKRYKVRRMIMESTLPEKLSSNLLKFRNTT